MYVEGDATDDEILLSAGVAHAKGLITAVTLEKLAAGHQR